MLFMCLQITHSFGQNFTYEANLSNVNKSGYYDVLLKPEISAKLFENAAELRLYNQQQKEIPYLFNIEKSVNRTTLFHDYEILVKEHNARMGYTRIVIHNKAKKEIRTISMIIKNSEVSKWLTLNGSDDNQQWFVVKDKYYFYSIENEEETSEIKILDFPLTNYEYYEILIDDYFQEPINILRVGYYDIEVENGKYSKIENYDMLQNDSNDLKKTFLKINFEEANYINKINLEMANPSLFYRKAVIYANTKNAKGQISKNLVQQIVINSSSNNVYYFDNLYTDNLLIEIENEDNEALQIENVNIFQLNRFLTAYFEKGNSYKLKFGDKSLTSASYDLKYFVDSIPEKRNSLKVESLSSIQIPKQSEAFYLNPIFLWSLIGFIIIIVGYFSYKMLKEVGKNE